MPFAIHLPMQDDKEHLAIIYGSPEDLRGSDDVYVRVHSECFTGEVCTRRCCYPLDWESPVSRGAVAGDSPYFFFLFSIWLFFLFNIGYVIREANPVQSNIGQ
jgi:hypothetical protein